MTATSPKESRLRATGEFAEYVAAGVGMAVASSSFAMLAQLFTVTSGVTLVVAVIGAGVLCGVLALSIGELASQYPSAPAVRSYFRVALGDRVSLTFTFLVLGIVVLFAGVEAFAFEFALRSVLPTLPPGLGISGSLIVVTALNIAGLDVSKRAQLWLSTALVVLLLATCYQALHAPATVTAPVAPVSGSTVGPGLAALGGAVFLYTGFEWVTPLGRRPASYRSRIPWSMIVALSILTVTFTLFALALLRHFSPAAIGASVAPHIMLGARLGVWGKYAMVAVSGFSTLTTFNAGLMGTSRLAYAVSREKHLRWGSKIWDRTGVPIVAVVAVAFGCWASAMIQWKTHSQDSVAVVCAALYSCFYLGFLVAAIRLRALRPSAPRGFRSPAPLWAQVATGAILAMGGFLLLATAAAPVTVFMLFASCILAAAVAASLASRTNGSARSALTGSPLTRSGETL
jgi:amino acid transporter